MPGDPIQLYLHVPFCEKKCHYCDFASWEMPAVQQRRWTEAVLNEIAITAPIAIGRPVSTVFFGGGTPSLLHPDFLARAVAALRGNFDLGHVSEMSLECNPSSLNREKLDLYHGLGFRRVSLGVQSFRAGELETMGRAHDPDGARRALALLAADGRFEFSGDLIFGLPGQDVAGFLGNLRELLGYGPGHVSFYGLTVEPGTVFERRRREGTLELPPAEAHNAMYLEGAALLAARGYERYEVSNFALPGRACRHNQGYWSGAEYLAFGPGAHSYRDGRRWMAPRGFEEYLAWALSGCPDEGLEAESLTPENRLAEAVFLGLRQAPGVDLDALAHRHGARFPASAAAKWEGAGFLVREGGRIRLEGEGWLFLDEICADLLARACPA